MRKIILFLLIILVLPTCAFAVEGDPVFPPGPTAPTGLIATYITQTSIDISWQDNPSVEEITNYNIYKDGVYLTSKTGTNYTVSNLEPENSYQFYVTAENINGEGPASEVLTITTSSPFTPPVNLRTTNVGATNINLTWDGSSPIYNIYLGQGGTYSVIDQTTETSYAITDLQPEQVYDVYVTSVYDTGESEPSNVLSLTLGAAPVPASVQDIAAASFPYIEMLAPFLIISFAIGATFLIIEKIPVVFGRRRY